MVKIQKKQAKAPFNRTAGKKESESNNKNIIMKSGLKLKSQDFKPKKKCPLRKGAVMNMLEKGPGTKSSVIHSLDASKGLVKIKQKVKNGPKVAGNLKQKNNQNKTGILKNKGTQEIEANKAIAKTVKVKTTTEKIGTKNAGKFEEEEFNNIVSIENVERMVSGLKKIVLEETAKSKQIFEEYKYILNLAYFNIPNCPQRMVKLRLKNSLLTDDDDVILFVKDLHRGSKVDYESTIQHYEDLLREKGIKGIKTIMPFNQLKKEYGSYEMKNKLSNLYEHYLCDGAIVGHVVGFLGKKFQKPRSTIYAIRMNVPDVAKEIEKAKHKTCFHQGEKGSLISIAVGNHKMSSEQIAENILMIVSQFKTLLPGGLPNIRNMYLKINIRGTSSLPIYMNNGQPPSKIPNIVGPKEKKLRKLANETNEILTKFHMSDDGKLIPLTSSEIIDRKRKQDSIVSLKSKKIKNGSEKQINSTQVAEISKIKDFKVNVKQNSNKDTAVDINNANKSTSDESDSDLLEADVDNRDEDESGENTETGDEDDVDDDDGDEDDDEDDDTESE